MVEGFDHTGRELDPVDVSTSPEFPLEVRGCIAEVVVVPPASKLYAVSVAVPVPPPVTLRVLNVGADPPPAETKGLPEVPAAVAVKVVPPRTTPFVVNVEVVPVPPLETATGILRP